ncbi:MAG: CapA family protein [Chloroflexota bacterium]
MRHIPVAATLALTLLLSLAPGAPAAQSGVAMPARVPEAGANEGEATLLFVGDIMLGRYVNQYMALGGFDAPFKNITSYISTADLAIGNMEGPLVPTNIIPIPPVAPNQLNLTANRQAAPSLARAGFDLLSLANNHAYDAKLPGITYTTEALRAAGITPFGLDSGNGQRAQVREVHGLKLAFLGYTNIINIPGASGVGYVNANQPATLAKMTAEIAAARTSADLVIVMMHWGTEYTIQPDSAQRAIAKALVDSGADLVVGAHPHVSQGMELQERSGRTVPVFYSLGNALFDQVGRLDTRQGLSLQCIVDRNGVKSARLVPLETTIAGGGYVMNVYDNAAGQPALQRAALSTSDSTLKWSALWDAAQTAPGIALAYRRTRDSTRSSIEDLGTGAPTRVQLSNGKLMVSTYITTTAAPPSKGKAAPTPMPQQRWLPVWVSDSEWQVTGYSVGDANGDGTPDLVYTLWKHQLTWERPPGGGMRVDPKGGELLPHIYINSWTNGALNPLWHGSPRPAPLLAAAPAPIGKDGKPLLAVLESSDPTVEKAPGRLSLWQWTGGFGYELSSRLPNSYSELWSDGKQLIFR